ncbi:hypothetical protein [Amaricoccus solimangrovi]|uniref:Rap1a immunity protein domain-containing protein n=1 Tax=Amaricoccus solimangrovi TaxID=2589815 RepID=A0A501WJR1_9RHOB|nr:hypothetical protein [Amaricoccus solimangrovi]TPE49759.1 hypothetical protein FJM51_14040 [Amaricoccus solimangrovi]
MAPRLIRAALLAAGLPGAAGAVDLDALTGLDPRAACVAYLLTELGARYQAGGLGQPGYAAEAAMLLPITRGQAGRPNPGLERRIDAMMERISAEAPGTAELARKAELCRARLGL